MKSSRLFGRRFWLALAAVMIGNALYFTIQPFLPPRGRHDPFRIDVGLVVDFWICTVVFTILVAVFRSKH